MATPSAQSPSPSPSRPATGMDAAKKTLRRQVAAAVRALDAAAVAEQSARIAANVRALPEFANARALSMYLHMPAGEAQTTQLLAAAFGAGKKVYVPKIMGRTADDLKMVHALSPADVAAFPKDKWLIPDPPLATPDDVPRDDPILEQDLELVLLPGVAFDRRGGRLGHGKAYYGAALMETWCYY